MTQIVWFCPICGISHGKRCLVPEGSRLRNSYLKYVDYPVVHYLKSIEFDPDKPFACELEAHGRGKGKTVSRYLQPADCPDDFEPVKARLLQVVSEWVRKGWLRPDEMAEATTHTSEPDS